MRKHKKAWLIGLLSIFGVLLMGLVGASLYFYQYAFVPSKKSFLSGGESRIVKDGKACLKPFIRKRGPKRRLVPI